MHLRFPYGHGFLETDIPECRIDGVLVSNLHGYKAKKGQIEIVKESLLNPVESPRLSELSKGKRNVVIICSDHTRPVPSTLIIPLMLEEIREGNPDADITLLVATGCHRETTEEELRTKFGDEVYKNEHIVVHDCDSTDMVDLGILPGGGRLIVNSLVTKADLVCAEGFIEPHFFAGFSGGRKSVLPGIASRRTVLENHCASFIADEHARTGILDDNPIHKDMVWAARRAKLDFICNVVLNSRKEVIYAVSGDLEKAHEDGCRFLTSVCKVRRTCSDIVITSNGGYPLDQNIYQAVKGMTAAEACVRQGGVIVMLSKCNDGHGGEHFFRQLASMKSVEEAMNRILTTPSDATEPDQWQTQILLRVMMKATVILVSDAPDEMVRSMGFFPVHGLEEALKKAEEILGNRNATVTAIPDGVSVVME